MKRINLLFMSLLCVWISATAQVGQQSQEPVDSIKNIGYMDSLFQELPEVMITGERPIVKAEQGKLVYDVPRLVGNLPVDNAYDVVSFFGFSFLRASFNFDLNLFSSILKPKGFFFISSLTIFSLFFG